MALFRIGSPAPNQRAHLQNIVVPERDSRQRVQPREAVQSLTAVFRSIQVISHTGAGLQLERYQNGIKQADVAPLCEGMTNREFITRTIVSLAAWGNAYWLKPFVKGRAWKYTAVLDPSKVTLNVDGTWTISLPRQAGERETTQTRTVGAGDITHIPFLCLPGVVLGLSPLGALSQTLGFSKDLHEYAGNIYTDGAYPSGYLSTDQILPDTVADKMKLRWMDKFAKARREPAVLSGGLKYQPLVINPVDAEFIGAFNLSVQDIARGFGVPSSFMGVSSGDSLTYTTDESEIKRFKTTTLTAYTGPIEDALTGDRGPVGETYRFNYASLERADTAARFAAYAVAQIKADGSGWLSVDEIRAMEGLPANMEGGVNVPRN